MGKSNFNSQMAEEDHLQKLASGILYALMFNGVTFGIEYYFIYGHLTCSFFLFSAAFVGFILELSKKKLNNHIVFSHLTTALVWYALTGLSYTSGGPLSVAVWWYGILPLIASILISSRAAVFWSIISFITVTLIRVIDYFDLYIYKFDSGEFKKTDHFINQLGLVFTIAIFGIITERIRKRHMREKESVQERAFFNKNLISLGEMAAGIAHEINNPLTIIKGNARALEKLEKDSRADESVLKRLNKINNMIERTSKIVDSLRILSRDGSRDQLGEFLFKEAIGDVSALVKDRLIAQNIEYSFDISKEVLETKVIGVQIQLAQVLVNLINNAVDAIKDLDEQWIKVTASEDKLFLTIRVIDSGSGISPRLAEQIFTPFFTTKDIGEGTGLGLSLCHQIIKKMGGDVRIDTSHPNTCFEIKVQKSDN